MQFGIGHPPPTHQLQSTCVGEASRVPNLQMEFNYLDSFKSYGIFSDFVVPTWSLLSSRRPRHPHIVPVVPTSSPRHPRHPHVIPTSSPCRPHSPQKVPMWSPWSVVSPRRPHCPHIIPVIPTSSPSSPHRPHHPHIIPTSSPSSPHHPRCPRCPQKVPMWSPWSVVSTCCPRCPHVVPVIPMSFPSSSHHLEGSHIIPKPPDTHSTHPLPPWGVGGPESVKMQ